MSICRLLVESHADPTLTDRWGHTASSEAGGAGHVAIQRMLEQARRQRLNHIRQVGVTCDVAEVRELSEL